MGDCKRGGWQSWKPRASSQTAQLGKGLRIGGSVNRSPACYPASPNTCATQLLRTIFMCLLLYTEPSSVLWIFRILRRGYELWSSTIGICCESSKHNCLCSTMETERDPHSLNQIRKLPCNWESLRFLGPSDTQPAEKGHNGFSFPRLPILGVCLPTLCYVSTCDPHASECGIIWDKADKETEQLKLILVTKVIFW